MPPIMKDHVMMGSCVFRFRFLFEGARRERRQRKER